MTLKITPRAEQVEEEEEWEKEEGCGFGAGVLAQNILPVFNSKPPSDDLLRATNCSAGKRIFVRQKHTNLEGCHGVIIGKYSI